MRRTKAMERPSDTDRFSITPTLALAFLAGVLAVQALSSLPAIAVDALIAVAAIPALRHRRARPLAVAAIGFAWCAWRAHAALDARLPESLEGRDLDIIGVVDALPITKSDGIRATFRVEHASVDGDDIALRGDIRVAWYDAEPGTLDACGRWQLHVRLKRPRGLVNPGGFDAE